MVKKTIQAAAEMLDLSPDTIKRWVKMGLAHTTRSEYNHRLFDTDELQKLKDRGAADEISHPLTILKNELTAYTVIELFAGAGGLSLGLENAGLRTRLLVDFDPTAVQTLRQNRPDWNVIEQDVQTVDFTPYQNQIDIVSGGFPCQSFSVAGLGLGFEDTRGTLFYEFARCVKEVQPKICVFENVGNLLHHSGGHTLAVMVNVLRELGYKATYKVLQAHFHDVPQKRERLFMIGIRSDLDIEALFPRQRDYFINLKEALRDCPASEGMTYSQRKHDIMSLVPAGGNWRDLPPDLQKEYLGASFGIDGGKTGTARRLAWDEPCLTLTTSPAQKQTERCHPSETRPLTVREYARVQSFPDDWIFAGAMVSQYAQIGNAVPVNLGYHIGRSLIAMLDGSTTNQDEQFDTTADDKPIQLLLY